MAVHYWSNSDWQPLLQLNAPCTSPNNLCITQPPTLPLSADAAFSSSGGGAVVPCLRIGATVAAKGGDAAAVLAAGWNTSVSLLRRLNPGRVAGEEGGEWCIAKDVREE